MTAIFVTVAEIWKKESFVTKWHPQKNCNKPDEFSKTNADIDKDIFISKRPSDEVSKDGIGQRRTCAFVLKR